MIPFDVTIPPEQRDKNLTEKLIAENAGILNWLIQGYAMWKKEGLGDADAVSKANEEYRMERYCKMNGKNYSILSGELKDCLLHCGFCKKQE